VHRRIANPDGAGLRGPARVAEVDIVVPASQASTGTSAECDVAAAGGGVVERRAAKGGIVTALGVIEERTVAEGGVVEAKGVGRERARANGDVKHTGGVGTERVGADGSIVLASHAEVASILAKKGIENAEVVHEGRAAFINIAGGIRGLPECQVAVDAYIDTGRNLSLPVYPGAGPG
jgi:hypothetical protein